MTSPTIDEIRSWGAVVPLWADDGPCAGRALGISRQTTYQLARQNALPFETLRLGRQLRVVLADLLRALGEPSTSGHSEGGSDRLPAIPASVTHPPHYEKAMT